MLTYIVPFPACVHPRYMDRTFPLDESNHLRYCIFRRYRYHHMHMIRHQVAFLDQALLLPRQTMKDLSHPLANLTKQYLLTVFRDKYDVLLRLPTGVL